MTKTKIGRPRTYSKDAVRWIHWFEPSAQRKVEAYMRRYDITRGQAVTEMIERFVERRAAKRRAG